MNEFGGGSQRLAGRPKKTWKLPDMPTLPNICPAKSYFKFPTGMKKKLIMDFTTGGVYNMHLRYESGILSVQRTQVIPQP